MPLQSVHIRDGLSFTLDIFMNLLVKLYSDDVACVEEDRASCRSRLHTSSERHCSCRNITVESLTAVLY